MEYKGITLRYFIYLTNIILYDTIARKVQIMAKSQKSCEELIEIIARLQARNAKLAAEKRTLKKFLPENMEFKFILTEKHPVINSKEPLRVDLYKNKADIFKFETNLYEFTDDNRLKATSVIQLKYVTAAYVRIATACDEAWGRVRENGFDIEERVFLQTAVCANLRHNHHDEEREFLSCLQTSEYSDGLLVDNDCYRCAKRFPTIAGNCRLYVPALNRGRQIGDL